MMEAINGINERISVLREDVQDIDFFVFSVIKAHGENIPNDLWSTITDKLISRQKKISIIIELKMLVAAIEAAKEAGK